MDYEKKYKEALSRAATELETCGADKSLKNMIYAIFPELAESEDERIRKALINLFATHKDYEMFFGVSVEDIRAWLEKQGDKDKLIKELGEYKVKYTQKVLEKHINSMNDKDDERLRKTTIAFLKDFAEQGYENAVECIDWLEKQESIEEIVSRCKTSWYNEGKIQGQIEGLSDEEKYQQGWHDALEKQREFGTFDVPQTSIKDAVEVTSRMPFISDDMKPIAEFIMGYANWDLHKDEWNQPTLTVPLFRVLDALIQRGKPYGEYSQNIEEQGEQKPKCGTRYEVKADGSLNVNGKPFDYEHATITQKDFASVGETATIELSSPIDCGDRIYHVSHKPIEKNGEQKPILDFKAKNWYVSKVDGKIHDMTYNPTDKVEPKFKVGDWVVDNHGIVNQVTSTTDDGYGLALYDGTYVSGCWKDYYHLWTIQDAKDGDVLVDEDNNIGIYKEIEGLCWHSYIYLGCDNHLRGFSIGGSHIKNNTKPATKEQRDLLFQNMKESGYEWDDEKKELKKIEQKYTVKPIFSIGDVLCDKSCTTIDKNSQPNIEVRDIRNDMYICNNCSFPISQQDEYELVAKRIKPQSVWSEEDKDMVRYIGNAITCEKSAKYLEEKGIDMIKAHRWLESLEPQPKEWSDENERMYRMCVDAVEYYHTPEDESVIREWLKSLKDKITWKPSEEQMDALLGVMIEFGVEYIDYNTLESLYNDLKKL